jgi:hypothetical protein
MNSIRDSLTTTCGSNLCSRESARETRHSPLAFCNRRSARSSTLTDHECRQAGISPDGKWVACVDESRKLEIIPFSGGKPVKRLELPAILDRVWARLRWTLDGQSVVYVVAAGGFDNLWAQPVAGGPRRALTHFTSHRIYHFAFSHDGKQIAISRGTPSSDVVLISNFR